MVVSDGEESTNQVDKLDFTDTFAAVDAKLKELGIEDGEGPGDGPPDLEADSKAAEPVETEGKAAADAVKAEAKQDKEPGDKETAEKYPSLARTIARLSERENKIAALEKQLEEKLKQGSAPVSNSQLLMQFKRDPVAALKTIGFQEADALNVIRTGLARTMGDKAPDQYKKLLEKTELQAQFDELRAENEALKSEFKRRDTHSAQERYVREYHNELSTYLQGAEQDAPLVHRLASANRDDTMSQIMEIVMTDAQAKIASGKTNVAPLTPSEAARVLEAKLQKYSAAFGSSGAAKTVSTPAKTPATSGTVNLSNKSVRPSSAAAAQDEAEVPIGKQVDLYLKQMGLL